MSYNQSIKVVWHEILEKCIDIAIYRYSNLFFTVQWKPCIFNFVDFSFYASFENSSCCLHCETIPWIMDQHNFGPKIQNCLEKKVWFHWVTLQSHKVFALSCKAAILEILVPLLIIIFLPFHRCITRPAVFEIPTPDCPVQLCYRCWYTAFCLDRFCEIFPEFLPIDNE